MIEDRLRCILKAVDEFLSGDCFFKFLLLSFASILHILDEDVGETRCIDG